MYEPTKPYKKQILEIIEQTWETPYVSVKKDREDIYPTITRKFVGIEVDHTDGIGTKGVYHLSQRTFRNAALDALAMNLNDLALSRAIPYKLQNHIIIPEDDKSAIIEIIAALTEECKKRQIAITGGETSIQNTTHGLDISLTVSGLIKKYKHSSLPPGDILIGFKSSGLHSNGFTKVREIFGDEYRDEFVEPTKIYSDTISCLEEIVNIHGMMHITGGGFTKLKDITSNHIIISKPKLLQPHKIFYELYEKGVPDDEMYKTFNCGIGFIIAVSAEDANKITQDKDSEVIGQVIPGNGKITIESSFSDKEVVF